MSWGLYRNLQASLKDFLVAQAVTDSLVDINDESVTFRIGKSNSDWELTTVGMYFESETAERFELGSNNRDDKQLVIIDIYAKNEADRLDISKWLVDSINNGWRYYTFTGNAVTPDSPTKVAGGLVNVNFLSNAPVSLGNSTIEFEAHRHQITINVWITGS